jgi:hypothetical protein
MGNSMSTPWEGVGDCKIQTFSFVNDFAFTGSEGQSLIGFVSIKFYEYVTVAP